MKPLPSGRLRSERSLNLGSYHFAVNCQLSTVNCQLSTVNCLSTLWTQV
ncbi:hypothetical protein [Microcoleus sp. CAWBG58]|nr:hypothetical protein [Microcoleus sp. CAWBG58]